MPMSLPESGTIASILRKLRDVLSIRFERGPVNTPQELVTFILTRSAYIAQTSLYGYLKTRMGTRYAEIFQDEVFADSINIAKKQIYAACMADLSVFAAALVGQEGRLSASKMADLAGYCYEHAVQEAFDPALDSALLESGIKDFKQRCGSEDWALAGEGENAFSTSPKELVDRSPIADELKQLDEAIVLNSIRFRWRDVRAQLRKRIDSNSVAASWREREPSASRQSAS